MRATLFLAACLALAGCGSEAGDFSLLPTACGLGAHTNLPITMRGAEAIVAVTINERRANLVLDTGADHSVLGRGIASVLGVKSRPSGVMTGAVGGFSRTDLGTIDRLVVADQRFNALPVGVSENTEQDGVLGLDVLGRFDLDVNLPAGTVTLYQGNVCPGALPPIPGDILEIPAVRGVLRPEGGAGQADPFLMIPISLDGIKAFAVLDTGALPGSLVSAAFAGRAGVTAQMLASDPVFTVRGFGTSADTRRHRFGELLVGREVFTAPTILVGGGLQERLPVILGSDYFLTHRVWFSFKTSRVFVVPKAR